jgi:hypothetical protein
MITEKFRQPVTPAKAGVQKQEKTLDSGFRRNDATALKTEVSNSSVL